MYSGTVDEKGNWVDVRTAAVSLVLLALDTDLRANGETEAERYFRYLGTEHPIFNMICVAGRGSWFATEKVIHDITSGKYFKEDGTPITNQWGEVLWDNWHSEMLELLSQCQLLIDRISASQGPRLCIPISNESSRHCWALMVSLGLKESLCKCLTSKE